MIEWIGLIVLAGLGLVLILAEIIFVPGTTIVGILGVCFSAISVFFAFNYFGLTIGYIFLTLTLGVSLFALIYGFRSGAWDKYSLKSSINSRVNEGAHDGLEVGQEGEALSDIKPVGKADIFGKVYEVKSTGAYVSAGTKVKIISLKDNRITIEPLI